VADALEEITSVVRSGGNLIEPMLEAARAEASLGEICGVLRHEWGGYTENVTF
jgi:methylmalonyl-CoA mutase N-terminal domain/subunit